QADRGIRLCALIHRFQLPGRAVANQARDSMPVQDRRDRQQRQQQERGISAAEGGERPNGTYKEIINCR
ncbi:MAG: hypothetical protein AB1745_02195, partial [Pseudomonadota bacterium]